MAVSEYERDQRTGQLQTSELFRLPYSIPTSFLKLKYLKTELNVDNGTYAIV